MEENKKNNNAKKILTIIAILLIIIGCGLIARNYINIDKEPPTTTQASTEIEDTTTNLVHNPIDFISLQDKNEDIYAWIKVPGTEVNYPIVQGMDDTYYLKHDAYDQEYSASGAIYTQSMNSTTFTDRVTVVYGHNGYGTSFFTTLHKFEDTEFFNKHNKFVIYTPYEKLTYRIVSAFKYDDRHILNSFDFHQDDIFQEFIDMIQNPNTNNKNVRNPLDKEITINDNIVVLSTCITNQKSNRYLVCGVLINNEETD